MKVASCELEEEAQPFRGEKKMSGDSRGGNIGQVPSAEPAMVTQGMLGEYAMLVAQDRRRWELNRVIKDLLAGGACVEPGRLTATVAHTPKHRLTRDALTALVGTKLVEFLYEHVEPTTSALLSVREVEPSPPTSPPRGVVPRRRRPRPNCSSEPSI